MFSPVTMVVAGVLAFTALVCGIVAVLGNKGKLGRLGKVVDRPAIRNTVGAVGMLAPIAAFIVIVVIAVQQGFATGRPASVESSGPGIRPPNRGGFVSSAPAPTTPVTSAPTVESVSVSVTTTGCTVRTAGTANVVGGSATVRYRVLLDGVQSGATRSVTGSGRLALAGLTADAGRAGRVTYAIISPNAVSGARSWTAKASCKAQPTTPATAAYSFGATAVSPSTYSGECAGASFTVTGSVTVTAPPAGVDLSVSLLVGSVGQGAKSGHFPVGTTPISETFSLPADTLSGPILVGFTAGGVSSPTATLTVECTGQIPPA